VYLGLARGGGAGAKSVEGGSGNQVTALRQSARNGPVTIFTASGADGIATVETVGPGTAKILWRCPGGKWCGEPMSSVWAPDGKRLAVTLNEITLNDSYPYALHLINLESGHNIQIPRFPWYSEASAPQRTLGCWPLSELAWSPDGTLLAYRCNSFSSDNRSRVVVLDLNARSYRNGAGFRTLPTGGPAFWPSWSPDGRRIAYSTARGLGGRGAIYAIDLDGSHRRLLASDATRPAWSPDGTRIAYESRCGLRLVTPVGSHVSPGGVGRCRAMGPRGLPGWSPDGTKIAIETSKGIYVVNADGSDLRFLTHKTDNVLDESGANGLERPSWRPRR
jgi:hypothetical protein